MKCPLSVHFALALLCSSGAAACELPADNSHYLDAMEEERELTTQALAKSDLVFIGTVATIKAGPVTLGPGDRTSEVEVEISEVLVGSAASGATVTLNANLHHQVVGCFGNETFWDDQVDSGGDYIFFVSAGKILSASPPARSWKRLGLSGQRELVLALTKRPDET